eukprot:5254707-Alexandrium_andersonii.AAC.1
MGRGSANGSSDWRYGAGGRGWGKGHGIQSRDSGKAEWSFVDSSMQGNGLRGTAQGDVSTYKASIQHAGQWAWACAQCGG